MYRMIVLLFLLPAMSIYAGRGEAKLIPKDGETEKAGEIAIKSRNPSVAICAFGMFMESNSDMGSDNTVKVLTKFASKKGYFHKAVGLTAFSDIEPLIPKIKDYKDGELAAYIVAAKAYHNLMYENIDMRPTPIDEGMAELDDNKKKKGNKNKKNKNKKNKKGGKGMPKNVGAPTEMKITIPDELFKSRSKTTQYLAILAASYSMQKGYADQVKAVRDSTGEIAAAKILFKVMTGDALTDAEVKAAFGKSQRVNKPIVGDSTYLSQGDMNVPALATLCEALGRTKDKKYLGIIHKALDQKDERVRVDAVRAIRKIADKSSHPYLYKAMQKCQWPMLIEICHFLGEVPVKESIPHLIKRFEAETGRFRLDVNYALCSIRGQKGFYKPDQWVAWWKKESKTFKVDLTKTIEFRAKVRLQDAGAIALGGFYSLSIYSDSCCFVVDYSASMKGDKIVNLKENMTETVGGLKDYVQFNICDFGGDVALLYEGTLIDDKKKALKYIEQSPMTVGTRSMDAIDTGVMLPAVDTIYFLSDGAPIRGQRKSWSLIQQLIRFNGRYRHVAMSTICFKAGKSNASSMAQVANENFGHTEEIE